MTICIVMLMLVLIIVAAIAYSQGVERWQAKVCADGAKLETALRQSSIAHEETLTPPEGKWSKLSRQPIECELIQIHATVAACGKESDGDYHLVLQDSGRTMVAEIPAPYGNRFDSTWSACRSWIDDRFGKPHAIRTVTPTQVAVTGYRFFDRPHGTGHAPNGVEIHPVIGIQ